MDNSKKPLFRIAAFLTLTGTALAALGQEPTPPKEPEKNSRYVTEEHEPNGFAMEAHSSASWDDNILGDNAHRIRDYVFEEGGRLSLWTRKPSWRLGLDYRPNALIYKTASNFNQLDQRLDFDNEFHAGRHLLFRLRDSLDYATGVLEPQTNGNVSLPVGGSPGLNNTLITPFARQFANEALGEIEYDLSLRSSFDFSGGHAFRRFKDIGNPNPSFATSLSNTETDTISGSYNYRMTRHLTTGLEYRFQNLRFSQLPHTKAQGAYLKLLWEASPFVTFSIFGGGEYADSIGQFQVPSTNPLQPGNTTVTLTTQQWGPGGGGSVTFRSNQTVFRLTGQRLVTDGGGLLAAVTNSYEGVELRQRFAGRWDVALTGSNARSVALQGLTGKGVVNTQAAGMAIEYPIARNLSLHVGYNYLRQRTNQFVPFALNADRDRVTLGIFYRTRDFVF
ncbi:MAG TPA: hypothetical protein VJN92_16360 [Candidatus Acidoferrum sp.]|nr:hypothetical protein [Candidatus Acidoferrum sp.]